LGTLIGGGIGGLFGGGGRRSRKEARELANERKKYGEWQLKESARIKPGQVTYTQPKAVDEYMGIMQGMSRQGLPGEDVLRDQMGAAYAGAESGINRAADTSAGALGALSGVYGQYINSVRNLGVDSARAQQQNLFNYGQAKLTEADYGDKAWMYNVLKPREEAYSESRALEAGGQANIFNAGDMTTAAGIDFRSNLGNQMNYWNMMSQYQGGGQGMGNINLNLGNLFGGGGQGQSTSPNVGTMFNQTMMNSSGATPQYNPYTG
ncbi:MAG TPA: hypothetical protein VMV86_04190, partial [Methanosarcinales archaeon]|nr:hypothetical protein [Methanosarcinales archaeon]